MASDLVQDIVDLIASRTALQTEADIQSNIAALLEHGNLNLTQQDVVKRESQVGGGTRHRIDIEMGHLVIEVKRDLRPSKVLAEAESQLAGYLVEREQELGASFAGILTDGTSWRLYRLAGSACELVATLELPESAPEAERLVVWLESIMATRTKVRPTPVTIEELLGARSPAHRLDHANLRSLLAEAAGNSEVALKRELWSKLLRTAYGDAFSDDEKLFVNHTLLVITAEAIAHAIVGFDLVHGLSVSDLVSGQQFARRQIHGVVEQDFFDWPAALAGGDVFIADIARRVARFDWSAVDHDVLKVLYESIIEQRDRESLGEYYTPDWLAAEMVADRVKDPLNKRVLDPSCGSGTFLFHAVKAYLAAADVAGMGQGEAAAEVAEHVFGIDIHPVAVTLARVTYLMAIGTSRLNAKDRGRIAVPVFLGDSLQWERHADLFADGEAVTISTSGEDLVTGGGGSLFADDLVFPFSVWSDAHQFDALVNDLATAVDKTVAATGTSAHTTKALDPILNRRNVTFGADRDVLRVTFETWIGLERQHRDRIWGYYVRNLVRPVWLALPENRVDVLIGNPPWLRYGKMTNSMQSRYRELAGPRNLLTGSQGATARDLATLFVVRAIELYLRDGGQFGFVMPFGTLSRKPHSGFRGGRWESDESAGLAVAFESPWDLSRVPNLFPMTSCVVFGRVVGSSASLSMPVAAIPWSPPTNSVSAQRQPVHSITAMDANLVAASAYGKRFRQGAILVPRMLLFVESPPAGPLSAGAGMTEVRSARSNLEKPPWKDFTSLEGIVEDDFLMDVRLGETIAPFRPLAPRSAVLPLAVGGILSEAEIDQHAAMSEWWSGVEAIWADGRVATETAPLLHRMNYLGQLSAQFPRQAHRVVYTKSGNTLAAARLGPDDSSIIDHQLYWAGCSTIEEARFLTAILNSRTLLNKVAKYQTVGLFGARHFDKYVFQVGIPIFDPALTTHLELAAMAQKAEDAARAVDLPPGLRFVEARKLVLGHLIQLGVQDQIDTAVAALLA